MHYFTENKIIVKSLERINIDFVQYAQITTLLTYKITKLNIMHDA